MQTLPNELIEHIVIYIPKITDKRQFTQTCQKCNIIISSIIKKQELTIKIEHFEYTKDYCMEKFTLELCNDSYFDRITDYFLSPENNVIIKALTIYGQIELLKRAIKDNYCELFTELRDKDDYDSLNDDSCSHAIISGNIDMLKFVRLHGCKWDHETFEFAVECNDIDIVKFLEEYNCEMGDYSTSWATFNGNIIMLEWLIDNGCEFDEETCSSAVTNGHFEILKILREKHNCYWNFMTTLTAAECGYLEILQWSINNGCDLHVSNAYFQAARNNHIHIIKWMHEFGYTWDSDACRGAAQGGHLELLMYLKEHGCEWDSNTIKWASHSGHIQIVKWARENGCDWNNEALQQAIANNQLEMVKWLRDNGCPE